MSPKSVEIRVEPAARPRVRTVVVFPGEEVIFTSNGGHSTLFFPEGDQIFENTTPNLVVIPVGDGAEETRTIKVGIFEDSGLGKSVGTRGALFVEYAIFCTQEGGETYFAEGDSPPRIIIPQR